MKKKWLQFSMAVFLGLALAGGLLEWVHPKAQPIKGPNITAVKEYVIRMGYQAGFYKQAGLENYLRSRMDGLNYHKRIGEWICEIHFSRDQTLDVTFLNPADPYPLFTEVTRELNQERTCEALIILRTNQELKRLVDLATEGRVLLREVIERQEMKLKAIEEGKDDLESWEFTSGASCYIRVSSGKRPLAIGIGY
jgi:hypothetical protein